MRAIAPIVLIGLFATSTPAVLADSPAGIPVDAKGGPTIDPTKNVLDLVLAAVKRIDDLMARADKRQDDLREAEQKYQNAMRMMADGRLNDLREADTRRVNELREAETRRLNELLAQKQVFDLELARVIRSNVDSSTLLLATQLKEVKLDLSDRTAKLEQFRWEAGGKGAGQGDLINWGILILGIIIGGVGLFWRRSPSAAPVEVPR